VRLARTGARRAALANAAVSLAGGLAAAYAGLALAHAVG
jgi:fluoride ion exporter CrcB/FEX